ncbi:MAG TPA: DUF222 domain-containing protein [Candidatus Limnocylindria bacterium]|nr:DUF222 domain-containing protein [Candidatus Limnocylindria bacterium]
MLATQDDWAIDPTAEDTRNRRERLIADAHVLSVMQLLFARKAAEFASTDDYQEDGAATSIDWIRINCHMTGPVAADFVSVGEHLAELPASVDALAQGDLGFGHLAVMSRTANVLANSPTARVFDERQFLKQALENTVGKFHHICRHARHAADPKGYAATEADLVENRSLRMSTDSENGAVFLSCFLDPAGGAAVRTALEPLARRSGAGDDRTYDRRMADALVDMSLHALDNGLVPQNASQRTHLQVTTSLETLLGLDGAPAAEMEFSLPISSKTVERLACDCSVTRILLGSDSMVIDVGRAKRVISGPQRKALNARDGGCVWPGCDRPSSWTSGHHIFHWLRGGGGDLPNLTLLCYRHHWMVHEGNWQIVRGDDGRLLTIPPTVTFGPSPRGPD